jgi:hypothetical protein
MRSLNAAGALLIMLRALAPAAAETLDHPALTAAASPADPIVGVSEVTVTGKASAGARVINTSTFPDGSIHLFSFKADAAGDYTDGPFVLRQLGTYRGVLHDTATGASTSISYSGTGDFSVAVDPPGATITTGAQARFNVTFTSIGGFGGEVVLRLDSPGPPGAVASWSWPSVKVPPNGSATAVLTVLTLISSPPGAYEMAVQGVNGSVTRAAARPILLIVNPPEPGTITALLSPARPIVGVTKVRIEGRATAGQLVVNTSTFPDGIDHVFFAHVSGAGAYSDGPFVLEQLGTYHDVLLDGATGAETEISYEGVGDFSTNVNRASLSVERGEEAKFEVTFKSLSGFAGRITPAVRDLSQIPGATASWSSPRVTVRSGDSIAAGLTIKTSTETPPGTYKVTVQGTNGSVTHAAPSEIALSVR